MRREFSETFQNRAATLLALVIIVLAAFHFSSGLRSGAYLHSDEYLTLERSANFLKFDDWFTVYSNNQKNFKKPPLQYWLTAALLERGVDDFLALRVWSFVFFIGTCVATAMLCRHAFPDNPWLPASSVLLVLSSPEFILNSRSGLLDVGMTFFLLTAMLAMFKARDDDRWWVVCGLAVGLGALQKAPLGLLTVLAFLLFRRAGGSGEYSWGRLRASRSFRVGAGAAVFLLLGWPVLQVISFGPTYLDVAYVQEMADRFAPGISTQQEPWRWLDWFWRDWGVTFPLAFASALWAVFSRKWRANRPVFFMAGFILLAGLLLTAASGRLFPRYLTVLIPVMACLAVGVAGSWLRHKAVILPLSASLFLMSCGAVEKAKDMIHEDNTTYVREVCRIFQDNMDGAVNLVLDRDAIPPGAFGRYVNTKIPVRVINHDKGPKAERFRSRLAYPVMGIGSAERADALRELVGEIDILWADGRTLVWRVESDPGASRTEFPAAMSR